MNNEIYIGAIIEESLEDKNILKGFHVTHTSVTDDIDPNDRWHIHTVESDKNKLFELSRVLKPEKYYAHFWNKQKQVIVVFHQRIFEFNYDNKDEWVPAIEYGLSVGIPRDQLDFLIE